MLRWESRSFAGNTQYTAVDLAGEAVLEAFARDSGSALYKEARIDLNATPFLHWRWRVGDAEMPDIPETEKAGDDYRARLYIVRRGGLAFWRTKAINYVWARQQPLDTRWPNPFAGENVQMWAMNTGTPDAPGWESHVRDVRADWFAAFGEQIDSLDGLALMTDTDTGGGTARSWYADIHFSASP